MQELRSSLHVRRSRPEVFLKTLQNSQENTCARVSLLLVGNEIIHFFYFSGTFPASEYLFSAPRGLFILVVFPRFRVSAQHPWGLLQDSLRTLYFSGTFPASQYLFSAPRGLFILVVFPRFRVSVQHPRGLHLVESEYLRKVLVHGLIYAIFSTCAKGWIIDHLWLSWVLAQRVKITIILGYQEYLRKGLNQRSVILSTCAKG